MIKIETETEINIMKRRARHDIYEMIWILESSPVSSHFFFATAPDSRFLQLCAKDFGQRTAMLQQAALSKTPEGGVNLKDKLVSMERNDPPQFAKLLKQFCIELLVIFISKTNNLTLTNLLLTDFDSDFNFDFCTLHCTLVAGHWYGTKYTYI